MLYTYDELMQQWLDAVKTRNNLADAHKNSPTSKSFAKYDNARIYAAKLRTKLNNMLDTADRNRRQWEGN
jgi:hypothetical protein